MDLRDFFDTHNPLGELELASAQRELIRVDAASLEALGLYREPYLANMVSSAAFDLLKLQNHAEDAIKATLLGSYDFFETVAGQRTTYDNYLGQTFSSRAETADLLKHLKTDALIGINELYGLGPVQDALCADMFRTSEIALGISSPTAAATIATALQGWNSVVEGVLAFDAKGLGNALANPLAESARFFAQTSALLSTADSSAVRAIEQSLLLTDAELRVTGHSLARFERWHEDEPTIGSPGRRLLVPRLQRLELRRANLVLEDDTEVTDVLAAIPTGQAVLLAREVIELFIGMADDAPPSAVRPIFKITSRVLRVCAELPWVVPLDRRTFADFIDDLYWLVYESPGSDKLRYLTDHGGPFERGDCEPVFAIKRLRNYFRHDTEHGSDKEIEAKRRAVEVDLRARGLTRLQTRAEYLKLHRVLLEEVAGFLRRLIAAAGQ